MSLRCRVVDASNPRVAALAAAIESLGPSLAEESSIPRVYVAGAEDPQGLRPDPESAKKVVRQAVDDGVDHLIVVSSAAAEEPSHHHPLRLTEDRTAPRRWSSPLTDGWLELEEVTRQTWDASAGRLTLLRPAPWPTGGREWWSRRFRGPWTSVPAGFDPNLQILAVSDLARAIVCCLEGRQAGGGPVETYYVAPGGEIPLRRAIRRAGSRRLPWPGPVLAAAGRLSGRAPAAQLHFLRYPATVDDRKIRDQLGYTPRLSSTQALDPEGEDISFDPYGLDRQYLKRLSATLFRFLHDVWWRIESRGLENIPRKGGAVLVGPHRGFQPWDGVMINHLVARETGRIMRFLVHPTLFKFPFLAPYMTKLGGVPACRENGDWVLEKGQMLAVFPEGIRGAFRRYDRNIYRLGKMGRDEYVRFALRSRAPIVPFVTVGNAEIYPIFFKINWRWWKRFSEWPTFPITPTMGLVPLPSKWHVRFLEPIPVDHLPADAADRPEIVSELGAEVKGRLQRALDDLVERRESVPLGIFRGSIFERGDARREDYIREKGAREPGGER